MRDISRLKLWLKKAICILNISHKLLFYHMEGPVSPSRDTVSLGRRQTLPVRIGTPSKSPYHKVRINHKRLP